MEDTIRKLTDGMNEAISEANTNLAYTKSRKHHILVRCVKLLQVIDELCDAFGIEMPDEAVSANIHLDEFFNTDILNMKFT